MKARFPLGIQLALPGGFEQDQGFSDLLSLVRSESFSELELNIPDPGQVEPDRLREYLGRFGLSLTRLATGQAARIHGLSLSTADTAVRRRSVLRCAEMILYAARYPAEVIIGFRFSRSSGHLPSPSWRTPGAGRHRFCPDHQRAPFARVRGEPGA